MSSRSQPAGVRLGGLPQEHHSHKVTPFLYHRASERLLSSTPSRSSSDRVATGTIRGVTMASTYGQITTRSGTRSPPSREQQFPSFAEKAASRQRRKATCPKPHASPRRSARSRMRTSRRAKPPSQTLDPTFAYCPLPAVCVPLGGGFLARASLPPAAV